MAPIPETGWLGDSAWTLGVPFLAGRLVDSGLPRLFPQRFPNRALGGLWVGQIQQLLNLAYCPVLWKQFQKWLGVFGSLGASGARQQCLPGLRL